MTPYKKTVRMSCRLAVYADSVLLPIHQEAEIYST